MTPFAITVFLSAFLLFQVQPLIGKFILPWFGGGPTVWTVCLLFFQLVLLAGYLYGHLISSRLRPRTAIAAHLALLAGSLLLLPIAPDPEVWKPDPAGSPTWQILGLLLATVGGPYFVLSSSAPLLQRWFAGVYRDRSPYRLYALSNAASLLALLSYPVLFEPAFVLGDQATIWAWAYAVFTLGSGWCAVRYLPASSPSERRPADAPRPGVPLILMWIALAALGSALLLATTNQLCLEVTVAPFLWVIPLALYLLTFVLSFDHPRWYDRRVFGPLLFVAVPAAVFVLHRPLDTSLPLQLLAYLGVLFAAAMTCHGELARSKPDTGHLTLFYLCVAAGGALGGVFVALVAPVAFTGYWEYHVALAGCCALALVAWWRARSPRGLVRFGLLPALTLGWIALAGVLFLHAREDEEWALRSRRNFFGVLRLEDGRVVAGDVLAMTHGRLWHGAQFKHDPKRMHANTYYHPYSGVGLAVRHHPHRARSEASVRVGVIGLGAGTIAALCREGDSIRFYEINPVVIEFAREDFTFLSESAATTEVALGDARLQMERELANGEPQRFDVLAVDAFSSGAIPIHLLTAECFEVYLRHLEPDGLLLVHIPNRFLDLGPVLRGLGERFGYETVRIESEEDEAEGYFATTWIVLTRNRKFLDHKEVREAIDPWTEDDAAPLIWTDSFASLWEVATY